MRKLKIVSILALAALGVAALPVHAQKLKDSGKSDNSRIVSIFGAITEIVVKMGLGKSLVAVDLSSTYPAATVAKLPRVGSPRQLAAEGIIGFNPTLVLAPDDINPPAAIKQIRSTGAKVVLIPTANNFEQAVVRIRAVADAVDKKAEGEALVKELTAQVDAVKKVVAKAKSKPKVLFVYARGAGTLFVGGTESLAEGMILLARGNNAVTDFSGFKPLTAEAVVAANPDVILIPTDGLTSVGGVEGILKLPGIALTPAGKAKRVVAIEDDILMGFGPRMAEGLAQLVSALHPELKSDIDKLNLSTQAAPAVKTQPVELSKKK